VDIGCWLGHVRRAWRGGDLSRIGKLETEGRYFGVGRSAKLLDGGCAEVCATCCGVNLAGANVWGGAGCKGVLEMGNGSWRAVRSSGMLCEVAGRGLRGSICFLLWGEPGRGSGAGEERIPEMVHQEGGGRYFRVGRWAKLLDGRLRGGICFLLWGEPGRPKSGPGPGFLTGASRLTANRYPLSAIRLPLSSVRQQPKIWRGQVRLRRDQGELFDDGEAGTAHQLKTGLARPYRSSGLPLSATRYPLPAILHPPVA